MLDLGNLRIGIEVDSKGAEQQLSQLSNTVESKGEGIKGKLTSVAGKLKTAFIAASAAAAAAGGAAVVKISKDALKAYAQYEQIEGGVKKLFGDDVANDIKNNAQNAFISLDRKSVV